VLVVRAPRDGTVKRIAVKVAAGFADLTADV
jgi:hypothetical protein